MSYTTYKKIQSVTVGSGGSLSIDFTNIPATYTDLLLLASTRDDRGADFTAMTLQFNDATTNFSWRSLIGNGTSAASYNGTNTTIFDGNNATNSTTSTFSSVYIYIPNYAGSTNKSFSVDAVSENNAILAWTNLLGGLWSNTAAITKVSLLLSGTIKFVQHSSATLYGIKRY